MNSNGGQGSGQRVAAVQDLRRSSASQRHVVKSRKGTRRDRKDAAIREWR